MKHWIVPLAALAVAAVVMTAAQASPSASSSGNAEVKVGKTKLGSVLVDAKGITLYDFVRDKQGKSTCYGACAALWPPLLTKGKPTAGPGVKASLLGTTKRTNGTLEVTYAKHPLYYWVGDKKPGQTSGQGLNNSGGLWWVLSPSGKEIHSR